MPIQILISDGLVTKSAAQRMHADIAQLFLDTHEISDNRFMLPNIIGEVVFIAKDLSFAGKQCQQVAVVELRVPSFTFSTQEQKDRFVRDATEIVYQASDGKLSKRQIWVNAVYAVDGPWGIEGKAYSNAELGQAIQEAAH